MQPRDLPGHAYVIPTGTLVVVTDKPGDPRAQDAFKLHQVLLSWIEILAKAGEHKMPLLEDAIMKGFEVLGDGIGLKPWHIGAKLILPKGILPGGNTVVIIGGNDGVFEGWAEDGEPVKVGAKS